MIKPDVPLEMMLEIAAVLYGAPALIMLIATAMLALIRPWRSASAMQAGRKLALTGTIITAALLLGWGAFLLGVSTLLEHPRYRSHIICEPCF